MIRYATMFIAWLLLLSSGNCQSLLLPVSLDDTLPIKIQIDLDVTFGSMANTARVTVTPSKEILFREDLELRFKVRSDTLGTNIDNVFPLSVDQGLTPRESKFHFFVPSIERRDVEVDVTVELLRGGLVIPGFAASTALIGRNFGGVALIDPESHDLGQPFPDLRGMYATVTQRLIAAQETSALTSVLARKVFFTRLGIPRETRLNWRQNHLCDVLNESQLSERWTVYAPYQQLLVHESTAQHLKANRPLVWKAIRMWLLAGGQLWIYGVGSPEFVDASLCKRKPIRLDLITGFPLEFSEVDSRQLDRVSGEQLVALNVSTLQLSARKHPLVSVATEKQIQKLLSESSFGCGRIVVIATDDLFSLSYIHWQAILRLQDLGKLQSLSLTHQGPRSTSVLSPDLGTPPIVSFWVLISGFVLAVGPLLYFYLSRLRRLYRIYLWVPVIALMIATSTIIWAVFSEGFREKYVSTGLTFIDSGRGQVDYVSESWYSPMGTQQSLSCGVNELLLPLEIASESSLDNRRYSVRRGRFNDEERQRQRNSLGSYTIRDDGERTSLSGEILGVREQRPIFRARPELTSSALRIRTDTKTYVQNQLGFDLRYVVISDPKNNGTYWHAENIESGKESKMELWSTAEAKLLVETVTRKLPFQSGTAWNFYVDRDFAVPVYRPSSRSSSSFESHPATLNIERQLAEWGTFRIPPGNFLGETDAASVKPLMPEGKLIQQVRVIMGRIE